jgi:hypothetical protein
LVTPIARARPAKVSALADFFVAKLWRLAYRHPFTDLGSSIALELDGDHAVLDGEIVGVPKPAAINADVAASIAAYEAGGVYWRVTVSAACCRESPGAA